MTNHHHLQSFRKHSITTRIKTYRFLLPTLHLEVFRKHSITTRIKTKFTPRNSRITKTFENIPLQQGLKLSHLFLPLSKDPFRKHSITTRIKTPSCIRIRVIAYPFENIPLQQGLKLIRILLQSLLYLLSKTFHYNKD